MVYALLTVAVLTSAVQAVRAERLLHSAIWLSGVSAMLAILIYRLGAYQVAVVELSVGAGLVTVLFVFAIGMAGDDEPASRPVVPKLLAWILVAATVLLLGWAVMPIDGEMASQPADASAVVARAAEAQPVEEPLPQVIWQERGLDALVQVVLIFSGILGVLGVLAEAKAPLQKPMAEEVAAVRERELMSLEEKLVPREKEPA